MAKAHLVLCEGCARHVRVSESTCPFCSATLSAELRTRPAPVRRAQRLSRAALFALGTSGAAVTATMVACSDDEQPAPVGGTSGATSGGTSGDTSGATSGVYGAPPLADAAYGGPPPSNDAGDGG